MDKYMKKSDVIAYIRKKAKDAQDMFEECGGAWGIVADAYKALADDFASSDDRVETVLIGMDFADDAGPWISVKDRLPEVETEVLIACDRNGDRFVCPAIYEDGTVLTQDSTWNWYELDNYGTYSEEHDDYFVPQGWWENRQFTPDDVYNSPVDCAVTDWMPLPEPPKGDADNG